MPRGDLVLVVCTQENWEMPYGASSTPMQSALSLLMSPLHTLASVTRDMAESERDTCLR